MYPSIYNISILYVGLGDNVHSHVTGRIGDGLEPPPPAMHTYVLAYLCKNLDCKPQSMHTKRCLFNVDLFSIRIIHLLTTYNLDIFKTL